MGQGARIPDGRLPALDVARGLAVLGMIWLHLVAAEGGAGAFERAGAAVADVLYGKPAALFCVLAGVSWAIQAERRRGRRGLRVYVARRAGALFVGGVVFGRTVWPTEILTPLALMMPLVIVAWRAGTPGLVAALALVLVAMPAGQAAFGDYAWSDWNDDGTVHRAEHAFGWITLRYYLLTGNYPLVGWLAFPLCGALLVRAGALEPPRAPRALWTAVPLAAAAIAWARWAGAHWKALGDAAPYLTSTWVPTSVPFVLVGVGTSAAVIAGLVAARVTLPWLAGLGRASLTHYVLHVLVVFVPLRAGWPEEDWSIAVGVVAVAAYTAVALPLTRLWLLRFRRGPLEAAWAWASGSTAPRRAG